MHSNYGSKRFEEQRSLAGSSGSGTLIRFGGDPKRVSAKRGAKEDRATCKGKLRRLGSGMVLRSRRIERS